MTVNKNELYHHGVKGMKWGVRKKRPLATSDTRKRYDSARAAYKSAKKDYNKSFNEAYNKSGQAYSLSKKKRAANDARWEKAINDADKLNKAQSQYKKAKKDRKTQIKNQARQLNKQATIGQKLIYNDATRKKAAKYIVDNNMSIKDATKKAQGEAMRNTAAILGVCGAVTVASLMAGRQPQYSVLDAAGKTIKNFY